MRKPTKITLDSYKKSKADVVEDKASAKAVGMDYKKFKNTPTATRIDKELVNLRNSTAKTTKTRGKKNGK